MILMILVSLKNVKKYSHVIAQQLPQRLKSTLFEIFYTLQVPFGHPPFENFQRTLNLAFEANSTLAREDETKIVKITHSVFL